jgi:hypothetical protein
MKPRLHLIVPIVPIAIGSWIGIGSTLAMLTGCKTNDVRPAPAISGFTPKSGPEASTVTITGINFSDAEAENEVRFNGVKSTVTTSTTSSITTTVPVGATSGVITVTVAGQSDLSDTPFTLNPLVGTWRFKSATATNCTDPADDGVSSCSSGCPTLTFTASTIVFATVDGDFEFNYTLSGHILTISSAGGFFTPTYVLAGGQLTLVYPPDGCSVTESYVKN